MNLFDESSAEINLLSGDGEAYYHGKIFDNYLADKYFQSLLTLTAWENDSVTVYGKTYITARKIAWYGDNGISYTYSGSQKIALPWYDELVAIKQSVELITKETFNSCLLNLYHNGNEGMSWHSDDEDSLGQTPVIASISFGAERNFLFRSKLNNRKFSVNLEHGSLLLMRGYTQKNFQHSLPKATKIKSPRINLTYRKIV